jgi:hypothetical protein
LPRKLERLVVRAIGADALEAGELRPQAQELLLAPGPVEPEHADAVLGPDRQRIEEQRAGDAGNGGRSACTHRERQHGERAIGGAAHQPARREAQVHDPAFHHGSSRTHTVGSWFESRHAAPPDPAGQRRQRGDRLPPGPRDRPAAAVRGGALLVLRLQIRQDLVALRQREQAAEHRANADGKLAFRSHSTL